MQEKDRTCILCGNREVMIGYICRNCQERIQKEAIRNKVDEKKEFEQNLNKHGVSGRED